MLQVPAVARPIVHDTVGAVPIGSKAIELVANHCDIVSRLAAVPPSARIRGLYVRAVEHALAREDKTGAYRELFPGDDFSAMRFYPLRDYLVRLACAGAMIASPKSVHEGMFEIARGHSIAFAHSLLGRTLLRLLSRDPVRITEQGLAARRQSTQYGNWRLIRHAPNCIEMVYEEEYIWIESALAGAATGTYEGCGITPHIETRLQDRFHGSTVVHW